MLRIWSCTVPLGLALILSLPVAGQSAPGELTGRVRVIDGDTLDVGTTRVRLFGIDAVERDQTCRHPVDGEWACGRDVKRAVAEWLDGETLRCTPEDTDRYGRVVATCRLGRNDVGGVLVDQGLAFAYPKYSRRYEARQSRAIAAGRGLWTSVVLRPERFRKHKTSEAQPVQGQCLIKGNISSKDERIYHVPGQKYYDKTRISPHKGERWFCSEAEARQAGWRKAKT